MITRSKRKAIIFCENNTLVEDSCVCVRIVENGKRKTYNCTPYHALNLMFVNQFVWFDPNPHI